MTTEQKNWIDNASYEDMLRLVRFAPVGDTFFADEETWEYFTSVMNEKRKDVDHVAISKMVGWR
jgi:hypothetical protein